MLPFISSALSAPKRCPRPASGGSDDLQRLVVRLERAVVPRALTLFLDICDTPRSLEQHWVIPKRVETSKTRPTNACDRAGGGGSVRREFRIKVI